MGLPKSRVARIGLGVVSALIVIPVIAMAYFQTLDPPHGVASVAQLVVPQPSARPALMGAGIQRATLRQLVDGQGDQDGNMG